MEVNLKDRLENGVFGFVTGSDGGKCFVYVNGYLIYQDGNVDTIGDQDNGYYFDFDWSGKNRFVDEGEEILALIRAKSFNHAKCIYHSKSNFNVIWKRYQ